MVTLQTARRAPASDGAGSGLRGGPIPWATSRWTGRRRTRSCAAPLARFDCHLLGRADRGCARAYIRKACGFSPTQIARLIREQAETGAVEDRRGRNSGCPFETVYGPADIRLLAEVDEAFGGHVGAGDAARTCTASSRSTATRASSGWRCCRARRHGATGPQGRAQGGVRGQRGGRGHAVGATPCRASPSGSWRRCWPRSRSTYWASTPTETRATRETDAPPAAPSFYASLSRYSAKNSL